MVMLVSDLLADAEEIMRYQANSAAKRVIVLHVLDADEREFRSWTCALRRP
jgi:hypothetical protein